MQTRMVPTAWYTLYTTLQDAALSITSGLGFRAVHVSMCITNAGLSCVFSKLGQDKKLQEDLKAMNGIWMV